ncbi:MAG TPA: nitroreductase [Thermoanaerobaculia bacterium]|nr:nitroreductase [Thermoanaerobaculia bacterium]
MSEYDPRTTPWQIDEADFYELEGRAEQIEFLLRYAILAPSGHNTQPWSFKVVDEGVEVYADLTRRLAVIDAANRELLMSVGASITNLRIAAARFGFESSVEYQARLEENLPVARIALRETSSPDSSLTRLFTSIMVRRTNRQKFLDRPIEDAARATLCDFIDEQSDTIRFVLPHDRNRVAQLIAEGDRILMDSDEFRRELADWMRPNETSSGDGICGDAFGIRGPISALGPWLMRSVDLGSSQAKHDQELAENAAGLIVITADDDRTSLIRAGEALERLLLLLTKLEIQYSFLNQPVEVASLRTELWSMMRSTKPPQLLLRIGYASPVRRPMPRRPVESVLAR